MATRIYLPSSGAAAVSPAFGGGWGTTTNAVRRAGVTTRISSAMVTLDGVGNAALDDQLLAQYVIGPCASQTLTGSIKGAMRMISTTAGNGCLAVRVATCDSAGANVLEALANAKTSDTSVPPATDAALTNRRLEQGASDHVLELASTAVPAGGYIFIELGYQDNTTNAGRFASISFGDNSASDLPEDETTTTADNAWVELTHDITFAGAAAPRNLLLLGAG